MGIRWRVVEPFEVLCEKRQSLVEVVVNLARDSAALLFLRGDQPGAEVLQRFLGLFTLGNVNHETPQDHRRAVLPHDVDDIVEPDAPPIRRSHSVFKLIAVILF